MKSRKNRIKIFLLIQFLNVIFSLSGVISKYTSIAWVRFGFFSNRVFMGVFSYCAILGIYAVLWQKVLSCCELSYAYMNKALLIVWSMIWAVILFGEKITLFNLIGIIFVFGGLVVVNMDE